jgi:hypothetical protein
MFLSETGRAGGGQGALSGLVLFWFPLRAPVNEVFTLARPLRMLSSQSQELGARLGVVTGPSDAREHFRLPGGESQD